MIWEIVALVVTILIVLTVQNFWNQTHFERHGIKNLPTFLPFIGNMFGVVTKRINYMEVIDKLYTSFPEEKYVGIYEFLNKMIIIKDLDLLKKVLAKDFDHFINHRAFIPEDIDPLFGGHLFALQDKKWKEMRNTLSPAFTGSKMRMMFSLIHQYAEKFANFYEKKLKENGRNDVLEIDAKQFYGTFTTDIIGSCAFGIEANSLEDPDNQFFSAGKRTSMFDLKQFFLVLCYSMFPFIMKKLKIKLISNSDQQFFRDLVKGNMIERETKKIVRHDMIDLLMEAKKGSLKYETSNVLDDAGFATVEESEIGKEVNKIKWTDDQLTAQVFLFFVAGFDATSTLFCFVAHELAANPDMQRRLQEEVDQVNEQLDGDLTYNDLQKLKYMDMFISEIMRYWAPAALTDRKCSKPYTLPPANEKTGKPYQMNVGDSMWIPIRSIHHDPRYYENPEKFDPERFSDENKHKIKPFTYLPFGLGPRNCIGNRFALMETKAAFFYTMLKFEFVPTAKTQIPLILKKGSIRMEPEDKFWVGIKLRN